MSSSKLSSAKVNTLPLRREEKEEREKEGKTLHQRLPERQKFLKEEHFGYIWMDLISIRCGRCVFRAQGEVPAVLAQNMGTSHRLHCSLRLLRNLHPEQGYVWMRVGVCGCVWARLGPMPSWGGDHSGGNLKSGLRVRSPGCVPALPPAPTPWVALGSWGGSAACLPIWGPGEGGARAFYHCLRAPQ